VSCAGFEKPLRAEPALEPALDVVGGAPPSTSAIVQRGGQTPLRLAAALEQAGIPILGTPPDVIDLAEDRQFFQALLRQLRLKQPTNGMATTVEEAEAVAARIGYPVLLRPSYVLGGRAMQLVQDAEALRR
jgi:carbamoyl-phosphate synthase large subunit